MCAEARATHGSPFRSRSQALALPGFGADVTGLKRNAVHPADKAPCRTVRLRVAACPASFLAVTFLFREG